MTIDSWHDLTYTDTPDYASLIRDDGVYSRLHNDPQVFADEMSRIFRKTWLFVAHESEIARPGDYVSRILAATPVLVSRSASDKINVLVNRCPHRGNTVCQTESGNTSSFRCAYHGWTFRPDGSLAGLPFPDAYPDARPKDSWKMSKLPRVETYRGMIFASFAPDVPPLLEHLAPVRHLIDLAFDRSPTGRVKVAGVQKMELRANWKMPMENGLDHYHASFTHRSAVRIDTPLAKQIKEAEHKDGIALVRRLASGMGQLDFGAQHREVGAGYVRSVPDEVRKEYVRLLEEAHGVERAQEVLNTAVAHALVFPNLLIIQNDLRVTTPVAPNLTYYYQYYYELEDVPAELNEIRTRRQEIAYGAAGAILQDDLEVWERNDAGLRAGLGGEDERLDLSRGMHRAEIDANGFEVNPRSADELGIRAMWERYRELMLAGGSA
jgi:phenylpropionate dioxygenase-like ring-hydroxylating dioxygenase large terminal subunit